MFLVTENLEREELFLRFYKTKKWLTCSINFRAKTHPLSDLYAWCSRANVFKWKRWCLIKKSEMLTFFLPEAHDEILLPFGNKILTLERVTAKISCNSMGMIRIQLHHDASWCLSYSRLAIPKVKSKVANLKTKQNKNPKKQKIPWGPTNIKSSL